MNRTKLTTTRLLVIIFLLCGLMIIQTRQTAAQLNLTVTRNDDRNNKLNASDGGYSLPEAVEAANASPTDDTINFAPGLKTIMLSDALIIKNAGALTINGPGVNNLTIEGGAGNDGIIQTINAAVTISGVTLKGGNGTLGGAIFARSGSLTLDRVLVSGNSANQGGGIYFSGTVTILIINSTISGNSAEVGGGLYSESPVTIVNSTISGNSAAAVGGGIFFNCYASDWTTLRNVTITNNTALQGGGIYEGSLYHPLNFGNTILAGNTATQIGPELFSECSGNCGGIISEGGNLVGDSPGDSTNTGYGGIVYQPTDIRDTDPMLGALRNNGGTYPTHAPLAGSPAIDRGVNTLVSLHAPDFDQRGAGFARIRDGNGDGTSTVDIGAFEVQPGAAAVRPTLFDYDGDGRADISLFRPSDQTWYLNRSTEGFFASQFGLSTDKLVPADYDGDGKTDIAVYRGGVWYWLNSSNGNFNAAQFGTGDDVPVPADFSGDGQAELAVYRNGTWLTLDLSNNKFSAVQFGLASDKAVPADYDGDGRADFAVYRDGIWYLLRSAEGFAAIQFGLSTDKPVIGDYDGDGKTDVAVFRPSDGNWYIRQSSPNNLQIVNWGLATDEPVPADYDGDSKSDIAVFRAGIWFLRQSANGFSAQQFGLANDKPAAAAYFP